MSLRAVVLAFLCIQFFSFDLSAQASILENDPIALFDQYSQNNPEETHINRLTTINQIIGNAFKDPSDYSEFLIFLEEQIEFRAANVFEVILSLQFQWERLPEETQTLFHQPQIVFDFLPADQKDLLQKAYLEKTIVDFGSVATGLGVGVGLYVYAKRTSRVAGQVNRALTPAKITPVGFLVGILISVVVEYAADQAIDHLYERSLIRKIDENLEKIEELNEDSSQRRRFKNRAEYTNNIVEYLIKLAVFYDQSMISEMEDLLVDLDNEKISEQELFASLSEDFPDFFAVGTNFYDNPSLMVLSTNIETLIELNYEFPEMQDFLQPIESYLFLMESVVGLSHWNHSHGDSQ